MTDPAALRSPALVRLFGGVMARAMRRDFHAVRLTRTGVPDLPAGRPAIVYLNHPSWWDPAFLIVLARARFGDRVGYGPIDAAMLEKYAFMARIGLFGVEPETTSGGIQFLRTSLRLLEDPRTILFITPEGAMTDPRIRPVRLRPGLAHLVRRVPEAMVVPLALEYPFWKERTPEALARFGTPFQASALADRPVSQVDAALAQALERTMDALAEDAIAQDAGRFVRLLRGSAGVGGAYDLWRRARAWSAGRRFHPGHGAPES